MKEEMKEQIEWRDLVRVVPDFPVKGIQFVDWLPVMNNAEAFKGIIRDLSELAKEFRFNKIVALESRGFLIGLPLALHFGVDFIPIRKKGKLPGAVQRQSYELEYGTDSIEIQDDRLCETDHVLVVDDLIATGGTIEAANKLVARYTKHINDLFLIELADLHGGQKISYPYKSLIVQ